MPDASVTVRIPVIGVEEHQLTVMVQLAPEASVPQLFFWVKGFVTFTDLMEVLELNGLVTVTVPGAQANMISKLVESVTRAPLPLSDVDLLAAPFNVNFTDPLRNPPVVGWKVTVAVQLCPARSLDGQLWVMGKSARDDVTDVTVRGAVPMLLSIVVWVGLAVPTSSVGNVKLGGVTADTATLFVSCCVTTACGRLKFPTPVPAVPRTIWSS